MTPQPIPVSLLPPSEPVFTQPARQQRRTAKEAPTRPSKAPAIIAKKSSPVLDERPLAPKEGMSRPQPVPDEPQLPREPIQEAVSVVPERRLPTMKELLPPATGSLASLKDKPPLKPIPLGTQQPQYISYFGSIKRSIDSNWEYPQLALRYGLQGTLVVEFKILASGQLEALRLVRSSGSVLLDEEALRAIKAAAPFAPIPPWIEEKPLLISARMEYYDGRLNYRPGR